MHNRGISGIDLKFIILGNAAVTVFAVIVMKSVVVNILVADHTVKLDITGIIGFVAFIGVGRGIPFQLNNPLADINAGITVAAVQIRTVLCNLKNQIIAADRTVSSGCSLRTDQKVGTAFDPHFFAGFVNLKQSRVVFVINPKIGIINRNPVVLINRQHIGIVFRAEDNVRRFDFNLGSVFHPGQIFGNQETCRLIRIGRITDPEIVNQNIDTILVSFQIIMTVIAQTGLKNILNIQIVNLRRPGNRNIFVELCIALDFQNHIVIRIARGSGLCTNSNFAIQI